MGLPSRGLLKSKAGFPEQEVQHLSKDRSHSFILKLGSFSWLLAAMAVDSQRPLGPE